MLKLSSKPVYRFGDVELDVARVTLRRCGKEQYLRQQTFQVLIYLLERRERLVTKEELIANIWKDVAVTDNALVQCIMDIRRSLGDDSRHPRFIKTIPKLGYRFSGEVEETYTEPVPGAEIEELTAFRVQIEKELVVEGEPELDRSSTAFYSVARPRSRRTYFLATLMLVPILTLSAYVGKKFWGPAHELAELTLPITPGKKPVVVMVFDNQSRANELEWLREGLPDMLITDLSRSKNLTVLSRQQLRLLLERTGMDATDQIRLDEALVIGRKSRAEAIILGSFSKLDEKVRIEVQIHDTRNGQLLVADHLVVDKPGQILTDVDLLALRLAERLGATTAEEKRQAGLASVMTDDLEAYRYYSLAVEKTQALHNKQAIELLEKAITLDPQFAMAHARIGYAYAVTWGLAEKGKPFLEKAFHLSSRLTEKDKLYITAWYAIANLDYVGAIKHFREICARYPMESEAYLRLGRLLQGQGRLEEALQVARQGLSNDPEAKDLYNLLGGINSELGRHREAIAAHQQYVLLAGKEPNAHDSLGTTYDWAGQYKEAAEEFNRALTLEPDFEIALVHLGNVYFRQGGYRKAIEQYQRYVEVAPSNIERARGYDCIAHVYWRMGNLKRAEEAAKRAVSFEKTTVTHLLILALEKQNSATSNGLVRRALADSPYTNRGAGPSLRYLHYLRGYVFLRTGRTMEAIENFKLALSNSPLIWNIDAFEDCLALAYLEMAQPDAAIAEFNRILKLNPNYPLAHYYLAEAYERKGQREQARALYQRFLEVWADADVDVPEVAEARKFVF